MRTKTIATLAAAAIVVAGCGYAYGATTAAPATPITTLTFCQSTTGEMKAVSATAACPKGTTKYQLSGVVGPIGPQGVQGVPGPQGPAGTPASTCYEYPHPGANYAGCDLHGVQLEGVQMPGSNLVGTNFAGADMQRVAVQANLCGSNAHLAKFNGANLQQVHFCGADLTGADFSGADLQQVDFSGANLTGAVGIGYTYSYANWTNAICPDGTIAHADSAYIIYGYSCAGNGVPV